MNFKTAGLLLMSDDVLLKYWRLDTLDTAKIWYPFELECSYPVAENIDKVTQECMFEGRRTVFIGRSVWQNLEILRPVLKSKAPNLVGYLVL